VAECIELARTTHDTGTRADLLTLAQKWLDVASHRFPPGQLLTLLEEFNEWQLKQHSAASAKASDSDPHFDPLVASAAPD
jgi:hypothetical protein